MKISYLPNIARSGRTSLRLDMWDSETESIFLQVNYSAGVANLEVKPSEIVIASCFINLSYTRTITIENKSDIEGYFYILPQSVSKFKCDFLNLTAIDHPKISTLRQFQFLKPLFHAK